MAHVNIFEIPRNPILIYIISAENVIQATYNAELLHSV